jgi:hypothetical protein
VRPPQRLRATAWWEALFSSSVCCRGPWIYLWIIMFSTAVTRQSSCCSGNGITRCDLYSSSMPLLLLLGHCAGLKDDSGACVVPLRVSRGSQRAIGSQMGCTPLGEFRWQLTVGHWLGLGSCCVPLLCNDSSIDRCCLSSPLCSQPLSATTHTHTARSAHADAASKKACQ